MFEYQRRDEEQIQETQIETNSEADVFDLDALLLKQLAKGEEAKRSGMTIADTSNSDAPKDLSHLSKFWSDIIENGGGGVTQNTVNEANSRSVELPNKNLLKATQDKVTVALTKLCPAGGNCTVKGGCPDLCLHPVKDGLFIP